MANNRYQRSTGRLGRAFGAPVEEKVQDPYAVNTPMSQIDPRSNPYGQGGGLRGRLRDALLAGGSAGHNRNRMAPVMQARMFDRGMAPEQQNYMAEQREQQEYQQQQQDRVDGKRNKLAAYNDYLTKSMARGETGQMSMRSWLSMSDADRSQIISVPVNNGYGTVKNSGMFEGTQGDWNALSPTDQSEILRSATRGSTGNPYSTVVKAGLFNGSQADFEALSAADQSELIMQATAGSNVRRGWMSSEDMLQEYDMSKFPPELVKLALEFGDPILLGPPNAVNGITPESIAREEASRVKYRKEMTPLWTLQEGHAMLVTALQRGDGAGDIAAIFQFMKNLDPNSTVREGEFKLAAEVAGLKEKALNLFDKYSEGDTLPVEARRQLADFSRQIVELSKSRRDELQEDYKYRIGRYNMNQKAVMGSRSPYDYDNLPTYNMPDTVPTNRVPGSVGETADALEGWFREEFN